MDFGWGVIVWGTGTLTVQFPGTRTLPSQAPSLWTAPGQEGLPRGSGHPCRGGRGSPARARAARRSAAVFRQFCCLLFTLLPVALGFWRQGLCPCQACGDPACLSLPRAGVTAADPDRPQQKGSCRAGGPAGRLRQEGASFESSPGHQGLRETPCLHIFKTGLRRSSVRGGRAPGSTPRVVEKKQTHVHPSMCVCVLPTSSQQDPVPWGLGHHGDSVYLPSSLRPYPTDSRSLRSWGSESQSVNIWWT